MTAPVSGFHGSGTCSIRVKTLDAVGLAVHVGGEVDLAAAGTLRAVLEDCLAERRPIALDLGSVTFIDRAGLDVIDHLCRRAPTPVAVVATSPCVDRLLALTGHRELPATRLVG